MTQQDEWELADMLVGKNLDDLILIEKTLFNKIKYLLVIDINNKLRRNVLI